MPNSNIHSHTLLASVWELHGAYLKNADPVLANMVEAKVRETRDAHQRTMEAAFKLVETKGDWRAAIDAVVDVSEHDASVVSEAITHFTGTVAKVEAEDCLCHARFTSVGYRNGPCGP